MAKSIEILIMHTDHLNLGNEEYYFEEKGNNKPRFLYNR